MAKRFSHQMSKTFHIWKWIFFTISTFAIVEETPSTFTIHRIDRFYVLRWFIFVLGIFS